MLKESQRNAALKEAENNKEVIKQNKRRSQGRRKGDAEWARAGIITHVKFVPSSSLEGKGCHVCETSL